VRRRSVTALFGRPTTGFPVARYVSFRAVFAAVSGRERRCVDAAVTCG
jgi:hypothetical protein